MKKHNKVILILAVSWILLLVIGWILWFAAERHRLNVALDAIRARGEAVSFAEFAPAPVPPDQNTVTLYVQTSNLYQALPAEVRKPLEPSHPDKPLTEDQLKTARASLDSCSDIFALIHQAGQRPSFRLSIDYAEVDPSKARLGELAQVQTPARLLRISARVDIAQGRFDHAADSVSEMLPITRGLSQSPNLLALLVAIQIEKMTFSTLQELLDKSDLSAPVLQSLLKSLPDAVDRKPLIQALRAERAEWLTYLRNCPFMLGTSFPWSWSKGSAAPLFKPSFDHEAVLYIEGMDSFIPLADKSSVESSKPVRDLIDTFARDRRSVTLRFLFPSLPVALKSYDSALVRRGLARTAVALRLYRLAHGKYPDSLSALVPEFVPELLADPFSGNPFVYRVEDKGFLLYSLGPNLTDEGGIASSPHQNDGDIVWRSSR